MVFESKPKEAGPLRVALPYDLVNGTLRTHAVHVHVITAPIGAVKQRKTICASKLE